MTENKTILEFTDQLSSKAPVPGGGGASALAGAFAASLGMMVCNLTIGKEKFADVQEAVERDLAHLDAMKKQFFRLADKDEQVFLPLSKAYGMPKSTEEEKRVRAVYMEQVLYDASLVPLSVMESAEAVADTLMDVAEKGSRLAVSDVGAAAAYLRTCVQGASFTVLINVRAMKQEDRRKQLEERADGILSRTLKKADEIEKIVRTRI